MPSQLTSRELVFFKLFSYALSKQLTTEEIDIAVNPALGLLERGLSVNKAMEIGMTCVAIISAQKIIDSLKVRK
jgi:hypothetical protein